jgi:hypothetical protein
MMVCMAGLQVFIVRFFFQVCCPSVAAGAKGVSSANWSPLGREKGIRVNDWAIARHCVLWFWWDSGKIWHGSRNSVYFYITTLMSEGIDC